MPLFEKLKSYIGPTVVGAIAAIAAYNAKGVATTASGGGGFLSSYLDYGLAAVFCIMLLAWGWKLGGVVVTMASRKLLGAPEHAGDPIGSDSGAHTAIRRKGKDKDTGSYARKIPLSNHTLFSCIETLQSIYVSRLRCGCAVRTKLLKVMVTLYLDTWRIEVLNFVKQQEGSGEIDSTGLEHAANLEPKISTLLADIQAKIHGAWATRGVPTAAVTAFDRWHSALIEILVDHGKRTASSPFFATNRERIVAAMAQVAFALSLVVIEAKLTLKRMNGTLDGISFDNEVIRGIDDTEEQPSDEDTDGVFGPMASHPPRKLRSGEHRISRASLPLVNPEDEPEQR